MGATPRLVRTDAVPICVDLDGTLIRTDLFWEYAIALIRHKPWRAIEIPFRFLANRASCKRFLTELVQVDVSVLPYNDGLRQWLAREALKGRELVLATAADQTIAEQVSAHLGIFDRVIGSDGRTNNKAENKRYILERVVGPIYDYVGNSKADIPIWRSSRYAIVVEATASVEAKARVTTEVTQIFPRSSSILKALIRELRPHQWTKNLLLYVPVIASHQVTNQTAIVHASLAFVAFCCCASAAYVINDLLDLEADRHHPKKRLRPFASGNLPLAYAFLIAPALLLTAGLALGLDNWTAALWVSGYFVTTVAYSSALKEIALLDVFVLSFLYVARICVGGVATGIVISQWLLSFSFLAFLSLGFCKRAAELEGEARRECASSSGGPQRRPYVTSDLLQLQVFGVTCSGMGALLLALYITSEDVHLLYAKPIRLWSLFPLVLFWFARMWRLTRHEPSMEDPVLFAIKDSVTWIITVVVFVILYMAS
jgi:4-hydroxybenzoate polyprenyltransferase/phosphoserine phosphatase